MNPVDKAIDILCEVVQMCVLREDELVSGMYPPCSLDPIRSEDVEPRSFFTGARRGGLLFRSQADATRGELDLRRICLKKLLDCLTYAQLSRVLQRRDLAPNLIPDLLSLVLNLDKHPSLIRTLLRLWPCATLKLSTLMNRIVVSKKENDVDFRDIGRVDVIELVMNVDEESSPLRRYTALCRSAIGNLLQGLRLLHVQEAEAGARLSKLESVDVTGFGELEPRFVSNLVPGTDQPYIASPRPHPSRRNLICNLDDSFFSFFGPRGKQLLPGLRVIPRAVKTLTSIPKKTTAVTRGDLRHLDSVKIGPVNLDRVEMLKIIRSDLASGPAVNLRKLDLSGCRLDLDDADTFDAFRDALNRLTELRRLDVSQVRVTGKCPNLFRYCTFSLTYLGAEHCHLSYEDVSAIGRFACFKAIKELRITGNAVLRLHELAMPRLCRDLTDLLFLSVGHQDVGSGDAFFRDQLSLCRKLILLQIEGEVFNLNQCRSLVLPQLFGHESLLYARLYHPFRRPDYARACHRDYCWFEDPTLDTPASDVKMLNVSERLARRRPPLEILWICGGRNSFPDDEFFPRYDR